MRVTYAINARIAGGGIGNTAHNAIRAIHQKGWLRRLIVSSSKTLEFADTDTRSLHLVGRAMKRIANYDATNRLNLWCDAAFDRWASWQIPESDVFHGWNNHALASLQTATRLGAKTIIERGGSHILQADELLRDEFKRWGWPDQGVVRGTIERSLKEFDRTDYIMVPSQYNADSFSARGFPRSKILLLPLGVDTQRFRASNDQKPTSNVGFRAIFVGQVSLRKGVQYLLPAWRKAALPRAELIIAGAIKADAARIVEPYRADATIRWQGHVDNPVALYQSADVFVFPSLDEGSALVTYEAMACGLPSIITHNAGSLVRDGEDGFIVPLRDSDVIAEKLWWLYQHPDERAAMGRNARAAIEPMTWERYGERLLAYYEQITVCSN
jgi:glycosyltransferase involved in cell wall biosynthesis